MEVIIITIIMHLGRPQRALKVSIAGNNTKERNKGELSLSYAFKPRSINKKTAGQQ